MSNKVSSGFTQGNCHRLIAYQTNMEPENRPWKTIFLYNALVLGLNANLNGEYQKSGIQPVCWVPPSCHPFTVSWFSCHGRLPEIPWMLPLSIHMSCVLRRCVNYWDQLISGFCSFSLVSSVSSLRSSPSRLLGRRWKLRRRSAKLGTESCSSPMTLVMFLNRKKTTMHYMTLSV